MDNAKFNRFRTFPGTDEVDVSVWVFKKRKRDEGLGFEVKWVDTTQALRGELLDVFQNALNLYQEYQAYSAIAENLEGQVLWLDADATVVDEITAVVNGERQGVAAEARDLNGSVGYLVRIQAGNRRWYAFKKSHSSWKTRTANKFINVLLRNGELGLIEDDSFHLSRSFDFYVFEDSILIDKKPAFESLLEYKENFHQNLAILIQEPEFSACFSNITEFETHVGTNMSHLRRVQVVQQRRLYARPGFMANFRRVSQHNGWRIQFDGAGRVIITPDTFRTIMSILLDHRLKSEITATEYDVPNTTPV